MNPSALTANKIRVDSRRDSQLDSGIITTSAIGHSFGSRTLRQDWRTALPEYRKAMQRPIWISRIAMNMPADHRQQTSQLAAIQEVRGLHHGVTRANVAAAAPNSPNCCASGPACQPWR